MLHTLSRITVSWFIFSCCVAYASGLSEDSDERSASESTWVNVDSTIYVNSCLILPFRFQDLLDSAQAAHAERSREKKQNEFTICFPPEDQPIFFVVDDKGKLHSIPEYLEAVNPSYPDGLYIILWVHLAWTGQIQEVKIDRYIGAGIEGIDLVDLSKRLRATSPIKQHGIPISLWVQVPVYKIKRLD